MSLSSRTPRAKKNPIKKSTTVPVKNPQKGGNRFYAHLLEGFAVLILVFGISLVVYGGLGGGSLLGGCPSGTEAHPVTGQCLPVVTIPICADATADGNYKPQEYWDAYAAARPEYIFKFQPDNSICIYCDPGKIWSPTDDQCIVPADICPTTTMYNGTTDPKTVGNQTTFPVVDGVTYTEIGQQCGIFGCTSKNDDHYSAVATLHNESMCAGEEQDPVDVCPNTPQIDIQVPPGYVINRDGDCVPDNNTYNWCTNIPGWAVQSLPVSTKPGVVYKAFKQNTLCHPFVCASSPLVGTLDEIQNYGTGNPINADPAMTCLGPKGPSYIET